MKYAFNFLEMVSVSEAVKINFKTSTDLEIIQYIGLTLTTAGDRDGGDIKEGQVRF